MSRHRRLQRTLRSSRRQAAVRKPRWYRRISAMLRDLAEILRDDSDGAVIWGGLDDGHTGELVPYAEPGSYHRTGPAGPWRSWLLRQQELEAAFMAGHHADVLAVRDWLRAGAGQIGECVPAAREWIAL